MDKQNLEIWVNDKRLFRKELRKNNNAKELYIFLSQIKEINGYKLYVDNRWGIPVEDVVIWEDGYISVYFYLFGKRRYKTIKDFISRVELTTCDKYSTFSLTYYDKK